MAKKRKAKKKSSKRKVRRVKTRVAMKKVRPVAAKKPTPLQSAYTLTMAGGIIILIAGILALVFSNLFALIPLILGTTFIAALINLVCGIVLLITAATIKKNPRGAAVIILVFSLVALVFPPQGFIVGPVLSLIGSIVLLVRK